jgi:hypothetical protein
MKLKAWQKNVLSAVVIVVVGFILFNVAFILAAFVFNTVASLTGKGLDQGPRFAGVAAYLVILGLLSIAVFISKLSHLAKATFLTMPLMAVVILSGVMLYEQPSWIPFAAGAAIIGAVLIYLYSKKLPWLYYFATFYVAVLALAVTIFRIEI